MNIPCFLIKVIPNSTMTMAVRNELVIISISFYSTNFSCKTFEKKLINFVFVGLKLINIELQNWGLKLHRDGMDSKCTHNNSGDRVRGANTCMGNCSAWLDSWSYDHAHVCLSHLVHVFPPRRMLQIRRPHFRQEKP